MKIQNFLEFMNKRKFNYSVHISEKNKYIYFETPKVACSTIKATLIKNEASGANLNMKIVHSKKETPFISPKEFGYENFINALSSDEYYKFTFVRNPYSRVLSAYLSKFPWDSMEKKGFYKLNTIDSNVSLEFSEFLEYLKNNDPYDMNSHWRPQFDQIFGLVKQMNYIGSFENIDNDLSYAINYIFGKDAENIFDTRKELGQKETKSSNKINEFYTKKEFDLVYEIYKKDFEEFGYEFKTNKIALSSSCG